MDRPIRKEEGYVMCCFDLDWEWRRSLVCENLHINLGAPASEIGVDTS